MQQNLVRIDNLLKAMSLEEKIGQLAMVRATPADASPGSPILSELRAGRIGSIFDLRGATIIDELQRIAVNETRLGIPLIFALDVLHGYETIFPIPLAEAAAFDPSLWEKTARAAAAEAAAAGISLTFAPMLDVARDPRWGRMAESPGEDPWLAARFGEAKVRGFQQETLAQPNAVAATAKHFAGYGAVTAGREYAPVDISDRMLHEVHLPAFAAAVRAGAAAIMPSLTDLAGIPMTAHRALLRDLLRRRWGFNGIIVSDFNAVAELIAHGVAGDLAEAAVLALNAGVDIDMESGAYLIGLPEALQRGLVLEHQIEDAVKRVLTLKAQLGLFENPLRRRNLALGEDTRRKYRELAREAARKSIVLLKNHNSLLPLAADARHLAVVGPLADAPPDMLGPWHAAGMADNTVSLLDGLKQALPGCKITYVEAGDDRPKHEIIGGAGAILLCVGETADLSGEASSRAYPGLPDRQQELCKHILEAGKPVVAVLTCGRPLIAPWLFERADAVIATWFLGSEAGSAFADVLMGAANPSGKLTVSWPRAAGQIPIFYAQRPTGRPASPHLHDTSKYIDIEVEPLFPFGHGLSYTRFSYSNFRISQETLRAGERIAAEVDIANKGEVKGIETAFLFVRDPLASVSQPVLRLRGTAQICLSPGAEETARFILTAEDLAFPDENGEPCLEPGEFEILVGPSANRRSLLGCSICLLPHSFPRRLGGL